MSLLEIEVKFHLADIPRVRERLAALGAACGENVRETNIRFEDGQNGLYRKKTLLRLRKADKVTLTHKSDPEDGGRSVHASGGSGQFKIHKELEVVVHDFNIMRSILELLGFHAAQVYEKNRETWALGQTQICVDQMPYGSFIEIEGEPAVIRPLAEALGLKWHDRILRNYLEMFDAIKTDQGLSFTDVTFKNFDGIDIDLARYLPQFRAG